MLFDMPFTADMPEHAFLLLDLLEFGIMVVLYEIIERLIN